ncbi:phage major capsid protein [Brevundimonas mediterranea]|uniref:phage major capsid protein n=1 Tax=Brevundimonas mediterranea TaxID=74329 RepID=UPI004033E929
MSLHALREKRAAKRDALKAIVDKATNDNGRDLTPDESSTFEAGQAEVRSLDQQIQRAEFLAEDERRAPGQPLRDDADPEIRSQSIRETILYKMDPSALTMAERIKVEGEQRFLEHRAGKKPDGIFVAHELFETRATQTTANSAAVNPVSFRPDLFTSALTASTVIQALGATVLTGLTGNVVIPRETGSPAVGWVNEDEALPVGNAAFDSLTLTPHHVGAITELSRQLLMQNSPSVDGIIRQMLARNIALAIDAAAVNGSGTGAVPQGILNDPLVPTEAYATDLFTTTANMIAKADLANVAASRGFLSTNGVKATAAKTKDGDGYPLGIATIFHGERVEFSNQVPNNLNPTANKHGLIYGDWADFLVGIWSQLDILVNPYAETAYSKGNILIRAMATVDFGVRRPASFVKATGVVTA